MTHFSAVEAGSYGVRESCRGSVCVGLVDPWKTTIVWGSSSQ
jgi:hypothetical protein